MSKGFPRDFLRLPEGFPRGALGIPQGFPGVRGPAAYISQPPSEYPLLAAAEQKSQP